ncbi:MFS transporter [Metabacillus niabensis]|uniref:EmrB/QacA subfamily drug resistance transporter n=1 Tax=Metabacillus niabensis TaxID=324854 RepID=A0ABT9Z0K4_9BACI|nr:MFS transporter [Metabacillus niabensis]MDQ0225781.1 EmrB/QacA subfamily drug resistance transporter [Metabacillus niabensis]
MKEKTLKRLSLTLLAVSQLILALDYTIIFVGLPSIAADLGFSANSLQWVVSAFSLVYGGFLLIGGRLSDLLGRRRMFIIATALFGLGSLIGGIVNSEIMLILARAIQGLGGALLSPATLSLIMSNFAEGKERNHAMSVWAAMGGVGLSLGLLLGGVLTNYFGWEAIFLVNVPITILIILLSPVALQESKVKSTTRHYDLAGTVSVTAGMILVVYYLIQSPLEGWLNRVTVIPGIIGLCLLLLFIIIEKRTIEPLIPSRIIRIRSLVSATISAALFSASFGTLYYFLTLYTQEVLHYNAIQSGVSFLPLTLSALVGSKFINRMISTVGIAGTLGSGMGLGVIGFMILTQLSANNSFLVMIPGTIIIGLGQAFVFTTMFIAAGLGIEPKEQGIASAIINTGQQIGSAIGLAVIMAIVSAISNTSGSLEQMETALLTDAVHMALFIEAIIALFGVIVVFSLRQKKSSSLLANK